MLYGMELVDTNKSFSDLMNRQCRSAVKCLLGLSKHSTNELLKHYHLYDTAHLVDQRKINFVKQLLKNETTRNYLFNLLLLYEKSFLNLFY